MRVKTVFLGAAAALAVSAPIVAEAADAARTAPVTGESALGYEDSATQLIVLGLIVAVIVAGISLSDDDEPASP